MRTKRIKVIFIIPSLDPGGIETYLLRFLRYISRNDTIDSHILVRSLEKGKLHDQYVELGVPITFRSLGYFNPINLLWYYKFFKNHRFHVFCDFNANFSGLSVWIAYTAKIKKRIVFYRQGKDHFEPTTLKMLYNSIVHRLVLTYSTMILSNSKAALDYFIPNWKNDNRCKVIYNGIDVSNYIMENKNNRIREELNIPSTATIVCHSGRLDPAKNHLTILKVAKTMIDKDKNIYFIFCGLHTEELQDDVNRLGILSNVRLLGFRKDVAQILSISDLFYFPSLTEGQPNALIEAMLAGLPIVASNIPAIKETIPDSIHKYLVDPIDINGSVTAIQEALNNRNMYDINFVIDWARRKYSQEDRFYELYNTLIR